MALSKDQIESIDAHFKNAGISYWDIRLEMTDHIASRLESMNGSYDFKSAFHFILEDLGWSGNLKWLERQRLFGINKIVRAEYVKGFLGYFTNVKSLLLVILFLALYYGLYSFVSFKVFSWISFLIFILPIFYVIFHSLLLYFRIKKVGFLNYGTFYVSFSMLMFNGFYQLFKPDVNWFELSEVTLQYAFMMITVLNVLLTFSGIKIYWKYYRQFYGLYRELQGTS